MKTALITGSSTGIGKAIALRLGVEGYDVAIHYRSSEARAKEVVAEIEQMGVKAYAIQADLTDPEQAQNAVLESHKKLGSLGLLVNNVGNYVLKPFLETSISEWHDMLGSNLNATFYTCHTALPLMRQAGYGRIINLGYAGAQNLIARPSIIPYAIAKTGVIVLSKSLAKTEMKYGITVNVVSPGVIENSVSTPIKQIPAGRLGTFKELTDAVLYFLEQPYITGQVLEVSGGWNL